MSEQGLRIAKDLVLPSSAALWSFADLAIKGAGKSYAMAVLAEEMVKQGIPILVIDPIGIHWGLRVGVDGRQGLPVVIFGGEHKDIPIPTRIDTKSKFPQVDEERLKVMVGSILEAGISAVVDTSEFSKHMQRRASTIILRELFQLNRKYGTRHVFLEEADTLAPQRLSGELNESFGAVDEIVRRGGNFNLGATLISQRPAVVNKDVLTQCNCLIILRILAKLDKDAVATWVKEISGKDPKSFSKWYDSLKDLKNGEAWVWHPESDLFQKIQFRKRETLHATREYFRQEAWQQKNIELMDVDSFIQKFKTRFEPKKIVTQKVEQVKKAEEQYGTQPDQFGLIPRETAAARRDLHETVTQLAPVTLDVIEPIKTVQQSLPNIEIHQYKPTLQIPVELQEPTSMLGKVAVVLKNGPAPSDKNDRWSIRAINERLANHGWDNAGVEDVVEQLKRWEIIRVTSAGMLRFDPSRVRIVEHGATVGVS